MHSFPKKSTFTRFFLALLAIHAGLSMLATASTDEIINVSQYTKYIVDEDAQWTVEQALAHLSEFKSAEREVYNFGMNDDALWIYLDRSSLSATLDQLCVLEPRITLLDVFAIAGQEARNIYASGQGRSHESRGIDVPVYHLDLSGVVGDSSKLLIRIENKDKRNIPLYMGSVEAASKFHRNRALTNGFYFGLLLVMILYNTFIFIGVRDKSYLFYIMFLFLISFAQGHMSGLAQFYIFPDVSLFKVRGASFFSPLAGIMAIVFIMNILTTRAKMPWIHRLLIVSIACYATAVFLSLFTSSSYAYIFMQSGNLLGSMSVFLGAIIAVRRGNITARFILAGWSFLIAGIVLYVMTELGVLNYHYKLSPHLVQLGSAFEVLFFSFALAERINRYREDKLHAISENESLLRLKIETEKENTKKLAEMELTALRGQMNPHFVFNALGAIQYYMQTNENEQADLYLTKFALLMRKYLESSRTKLINFREEIELLRLYTDLEMMRFGDKFSTVFHIDPKIDLESTYVPSMLIQPFVENAIKHGLNDRIDDDGVLAISFIGTSEGVDVTISDNGIGMKASSTNKDPMHRSRGMELIRERIATYQSSGGGDIELHYSELSSEAEEFPGTVVRLSIEHFNESEE